jgi:SWIM zinc finger
MIADKASLTKIIDRLNYHSFFSMNVCNCEDFLRNGIPCKHCIAVQIYRTNQIQAVLLEALSELGKVVKVKLVGVGVAAK